MFIIILVWNGLHYLVRYPPFSKAELKDIDYAVDFNVTNGDGDRVAIIATKPLTTNENWKEFKRGQLLMFDYGLPHSRPYECAAIERCGRGLSSRAIPRGEICPHQYQYNIPTLLRKAVCKALKKDESDDDNANNIWSERAVDIGCGSGLSGLPFRRHVRHLTGIEVSGEMAEEARERGCYNRIIVGDAECVLQNEQNNDGCSSDERISYDFVFACDLVPYIGDLVPIFNTVRRSLECKGGTFAFSAEILNDSTENSEDMFVMQKCARFCHRHGHIISLAEQCGFLILNTTEATVLRQHDGKDVLGSIFVFGLEPLLSAP